MIHPKINKKQFLLICVIIILSFTSAISCHKAGKWLVKEDNLNHADALVLLMNKFPADRILQAADVYKLGYAKRIIMVEENMDDFQQLEKRGATIISNTEQCKTVLVELGIPVENIIILYGKSKNTQEEALVLSQYQSTKTETDTLILISSAQSTRRASIIFRQTFKTNNNKVVLLNSPSKYSEYQAGGWWKHKEAIEVVLSEYFKIMYFWLFDKKYQNN